MLISEASQLELVEANLPDLGYRVTPVVPELEGKACENPLAQIFVGPVSIRAHPRPR
jgi:predicted CoA-binding protein